VVGFLGHTFKAGEIALKIGCKRVPFSLKWPRANLAFGVLGIMCIWQRGGFWTATGTGFAIFCWSAPMGHVRI